MAEIVQFPYPIEIEIAVMVDHPDGPQTGYVVLFRNVIVEACVWSGPDFEQAVSTAQKWAKCYPRARIIFPPPEDDGGGGSEIPVAA